MADESQKRQHQPEAEAGAPGRSFRERSPVFWEEDEYLVSQLVAGDSIRSILAGGSSGNYAVLSDRRLYFSGHSVGHVAGTSVGQVTGQIVLPLEKISSVRLQKIKSIGAAILGIVFLAIAMVLGLYKLNEAGPIVFLGLIPGALILAAYFLGVKQVLVAATDSAAIEVDCRLYGMNAVRSFVKSLGKAQTALRRNVDVIP